MQYKVIELLQRKAVAKHLISGRNYCYYNTLSEQNVKNFVLGENDFLLFTRNRGIINVEVKGNYFHQFLFLFFVRIK